MGRKEILIVCVLLALPVFGERTDYDEEFLKLGNREQEEEEASPDNPRPMWCQTVPFTMVLNEPNCEPKVIQNRLCTGACLSYTVPRTETSDAFRDGMNYCESCRPLQYTTKQVHLTCKDAEGNEEMIPKTVSIISECQCATCPGIKPYDPDFDTPEYEQEERAAAFIKKVIPNFSPFKVDPDDTYEDPSSVSKSKVVTETSATNTKETTPNFRSRSDSIITTEDGSYEESLLFEQDEYYEHDKHDIYHAKDMHHEHDRHRGYEEEYDGTAHAVETEEKIPSRTEHHGYEEEYDGTAYKVETEEKKPSRTIVFGRNKGDL